MQKPESIKSKHEEWWSSKVDNEGRRILDGVSFFMQTKGIKIKLKQGNKRMWFVKCMARQEEVYVMLQYNYYLTVAIMY